MKILVLSPAIPARDAKGYQVLAYHRLSYLVKSHSIDLICYGQGATDELRKSILMRMGIRVHMIPWRPIVAIFFIIKAIFNRDMPLQCALFRSFIFHATLKKVAREASPDAILAITIRILPNLKPLSLPLVLDLVDSMALNFKRRAEREVWWSRAFWWFEQKRVARYEKNVIHNSVASFVVSSIDKQEIGISQVFVLPLGVDIQRDGENLFPCAPIVMLTGNMAYRPNVDAAKWMASKCWPHIKAAVPGAEFWIVGRNPPLALKDLECHASIRVVGQVPSMVDALRSSQVVVAPMQSGSGMQFKILEAMAVGVPVVTTKIGVGDIQAMPGVEILVAESSREFIKSTVLMLNSPGLREKIGKNGYHFVQRNHAWDAINLKFEQITMELISKEFNYRK